MDRNGHNIRKKTLLSKLCQKYPYNRFNFACFYYRNIFCSIYPLIAKNREVKLLARQLGLGSAGAFIPHHNLSNNRISEPRSEKTGLRGFRTGLT